MNTIRKLSTDDISAVNLLLIEGVQSWAGTHYENIKEWFVEAYSVHQLTENLNDTTRNTYVAETPEGEIVGTVNTIQKDLNHYHVGGLYVTRRGEGVGSQLLNHALNELPQNVKVTAEIWCENFTSISFFTKHGFRFIERVDYDGYAYDTYAVTH